MRPATRRALARRCDLGSRRRRYGFCADHRSEISQIERFGRQIARQQGALSAVSDAQRSGNVALPNPTGEFLVTPPVRTIRQVSRRGWVGVRLGQRNLEQIEELREAAAA